MHDQLEQKMSICLVEDDTLDYQWLKALLNRIPELDFDLSWTQTYEAAADLLQNKAFDVAIVDFAIGPNSAIELLNTLGGRDASAPIIILTGNADYDSDVATMRAGAYDFLDKSILNERQLERAIRHTCNTRHMENELKAARDQAKAADRAKTIFMSNLSHDLRTPLNAVMGFSEILLDNGQLDAETRNYISMVHSGGQHLTWMINDLLLLAQFEADRVAVDMKPHSIEECLRRTLTKATQVASQRDVSLDPGLPAELPHVLADQEGTARIIENLVFSCCDLAAPGETITLSCHVGMQYLVLEIAARCDELSRTALIQMTEPFKLTDDHYAAESVYRVGVSLAIAHRYGELQGIAIDTSREPDGTTRFTAVFPLVAAPQAAAAG